MGDVGIVAVAVVVVVDVVVVDVVVVVLSFGSLRFRSSDQSKVMARMEACFFGVTSAVDVDCAWWHLAERAREVETQPPRAA